MKRESGYYWVKFDEDDEDEIVRWFISKKAWQILGSGQWVDDSDFFQINPKIILTPQQSD